MQGGVINTVFALIFALILVVIGWSMAMYFFEMGSDQGKREYKGMLLGGISALVGLMILYAIVEWLRALVGF